MPVSPEQSHAHFMALALAQANLAAQAGEVPVGAVVVRHGEVLAMAHNRTRTDCDPTAHAEVLALRAASRSIGNFRLEDCTLYCTVEPCAMCAGACLHARLAGVYFGSAEPRTGAIGSVFNLLEDTRLNAHTHWQGGVLAAECSRLMQDFFQARRLAQQQQRREDAAHWPLPEHALRTPEGRFPEDAPAGSYLFQLPSLGGMRLHWAHNAHGASAERVARAPGSPLLFLHSSAAWSHESSPLRTALGSTCGAVLAPDLLGFGRSDKPKKTHWHTLEGHRAILADWAAHLGVCNAVCVLPLWGCALAMALLPAIQKRVAHLVLLDDPSAFSACVQPRPPRPHGAAAEASVAWWDAPFPDPGHGAALRAPALLAAGQGLPSIDFWAGPLPFALTVVSARDGVKQGAEAQAALAAGLGRVAGNPRRARRTKERGAAPMLSALRADLLLEIVRSAGLAPTAALGLSAQ